MDPNGLRFWILASPQDWQTHEEEPAEVDAKSGRLRLPSARGQLPAPQPRANALARLDLVPGALDPFETHAFLDPGDRTIKVAGALRTPLTLYTLDADEVVSDMALGHDGVLYLALESGVRLVDLRGRWQSVSVALEDFVPWRLAPEPGGGVWVLERASGRVARVQGLPRTATVFRERSHRVPQALAGDDPDPPRMSLVEGARRAEGESVAAIATSPDGQVALLTWLDDESDDARIHLLDRQRALWQPAAVLLGACSPYALAWLDERTLAVLDMAFAREALAYTLPANNKSEDSLPRLWPSGDHYPLRDHDGAPFLKGPSLPPHYGLALSADASSQPGTAPLHRLSLPHFALSSETQNARTLDGGEPRTLWHRLYIEASIPEGCGVRIWLAATQEDSPPHATSSDWHEHRFGRQFLHSPDGVPVGAWLAMPSEVAGQPGLLGYAAQPDHTGLFTALVQRAGRRVRRLEGRYLHVRCRLEGDGRTTPEVAAVRAWASRFSYVEKYLPELYHEELFGPEGDARGAATGRDFLDRFVALFEGILTPLEERIAFADLLMDARTAPADALAWLASWIGLAYDPAYPEERRRNLLAAAPRLFQARGTLRGLELALDVATGGDVTRGALVVVEEFRLRRTLSTILGADLASEEDPLLQGIVASGNSIVGDTLFLGDEAQERRREFLALFAADLKQKQREEQAINAFLDRLANRVAVLIHRTMDAADRALVQRIVDAETPAHVQARVLPASQPFMVGMASLVGVDTFVASPRPLEPVTLNRSRLGERDRLLRPAALDPRLNAAPAPA